MNDQDAFERILASLYDAMLDETRWPATSALIDEACGLTGNGLMVGEGPPDDVRALFLGLYSRGQRREDLEREYLENYHNWYIQTRLRIRTAYPPFTPLHPAYLSIRELLESPSEPRTTPGTARPAR